ncbi:purple acid phosphatase 15-like [Micractinium conductrix]|uniref:Purple acid phosphatase n=1 Tax=Micractinium conductrix TaxID=554055 RepID=A0A2P6VID0_9CHLO|nr:purple acid phosphatase 15-like [Micractinium conductrix]|eukprot:PSC73849.1 purple acid phosphatase 15-like [Micractinium conductrix]
MRGARQAAPLLAALLLVTLLLGRSAPAGAAARELLLSVEPNGTQASIPLDPAANPVVTDYALDEPPVARTAVGWDPEGVHLTLWSGDAVLVSWQTGEPRVGPTAAPPPPHDPAEVAGLVRWGTEAGKLAGTAGNATDTVYSYSYGEAAGGQAYRSPILHHVLLSGLAPGQTYFYSVGGVLRNGSAAPEGRELSFRMPAAPPAPLSLGVIGDPGQTHNTSTTLEHLAASQPDVVLVLGDLSYADLYRSNDTSSNWGFLTPRSSQQLRWDAWARLTEPLLATVPAVYIAGNHEIEMQDDGATFTAFNARYPQPKDAAAVSVAPNNASLYLNSTDLRQFANSSEYEVQGGYWSVQLPWVHLVALSNYLPYDPSSPQYKFAAAELAGVDRTAMPFLLVLTHGAPRTTYGPEFGLFKELEEFMSFYEPLFYGAGVDLVLSGHVHSYERSLPLFNYSVDPCGTTYIVVGDGGNAEGPEDNFVDVARPPWCTNTSAYVQPAYQPTTTGLPTVTFQNGSFCPTSQPPYSAFREPSFGHAVLRILNATAARWSWMRNQDGQAAASDDVLLLRDTTPRVSATRLHGPDMGLSYTEATEPTHGVIAAAEEAEAAPAGGTGGGQPPPSKAAVQSYLSREEECPLAAPAVQSSTQQQLDSVTASPEVQAAAKQTLARESQSLGRKEASGDRQARGQAGLDEQAESVLHLRGGADEGSSAAAAAVLGAPQRPRAADADGTLAGAAQGPTAAGAGGGGDASPRLSAYHSPQMAALAEAEQDFERQEAPLFEGVRAELAAAREQARGAELKTGEAVQEARQWAHVATKAEEEKAEASPPPRGRRGLLAAAARLARQAADLEEESKRVEAKAFYLLNEGEHVEGLGADKERAVDALEVKVKEARALAHHADVQAARAELHFPEAEAALLHADTARSALAEARRSATLLRRRAEQLLQGAEEAAEGSKALMQRAYEKAEEGLKAKEAAQAAPEEGPPPAGEGPVTPEQPPQAARQLAAELDRTQKGRAAAELHAAQLMGEAQRKVEHARRLEARVGRSAQTEEAALQRAQHIGEAAERLSGQRISEQWLQLEASPEWRRLAHRFPEAMRQLEAHGRGSGGAAAEVDEMGVAPAEA